MEEMCIDEGEEWALQRVCCVLLNVVVLVLLIGLLSIGPVSHSGFPLVLPPMVLSLVAAVWCPGAGLLQVSLV